MSDAMTTAEHALADAHKQHEEKVKTLNESHAKAMDVANGQILNMNNAINIHEAEKTALSQSLNELLQANIRLRSATLLLDKQGKEGFALRDNKIGELTKEIADLTNKLDIANKVVAASTNLIPPGHEKPTDAPKHK
jgi:septal ring factor EnvC (AmiA/AmiB activator)